MIDRKKKGVSQNGQTPSIIGICSYCVLDRPVFERCQTLVHPELTPWWSFLLGDGAHHKKPHSPTHPTKHDDIAANEITEANRIEVQIWHILTGSRASQGRGSIANGALKLLLNECLYHRLLIGNTLLTLNTFINVLCADKCVMC